jgi:hypothetical protein
MEVMGIEPLECVECRHEIMPDHWPRGLEKTCGEAVRAGRLVRTQTLDN